MTLFVSRSQHLTILSSPHENKYGCRGETARPRTVLMCPVSVSFRPPVAKSQILIVRSPAPDANHLLPGSTARARTQPRWPEMTLINFHGGCHSGLTGCIVFGPLDARLIFCCCCCCCSPAPFFSAPDDEPPGPSSSFCPERAGAADFAPFFCSCFPGCFAASDAGKVSTVAYSVWNRRFMTGSSNRSSSFCRLPLGNSAGRA